MPPLRDTSAIRRIRFGIDTLIIDWEEILHAVDPEKDPALRKALQGLLARRRIRAAMRGLRDAFASLRASRAVP